MAAVGRSLRQWWTNTNDTQLLLAQQQLLSSLVKTPASSPEQQHGLNTVAFHASPASQHLPTVVMLHGFGSGLGFFYANVDRLLDSGRVGKVLLVDWLGMGGSDRPHCRRPIRGLSDCTTAWCQSRFDAPQVVDWFLDPLHRLLQQETSKTDAGTPSVPLWLVGHSLGGYLAARYALRHAFSVDAANLNLEKVVLASPVGFPPRPTNLLPSAQLPTAVRLVDALWSANVTPQQLVRMMGARRGRNAVRRALAGRIPHLQQEHRGNDGHQSNTLDLLANYLFHITVAHPSGEFAMNSLLAPGMSPDVAGVFAREPLEPLFEEYGRMCQQQPSKPKLDWKVLFGDKDWMRPNEPSARKATGYIVDSSSSVAVIPNAGHHLYLDNPEAFVRHILD